MSVSDLLNRVKPHTRLYEILSWMADVGITIQGHKIIPGSGWQPGEWEQERKWLMPYKDILVEALK